MGAVQWWTGTLFHDAAVQTSREGLDSHSDTETPPQPSFPTTRCITGYAPTVTQLYLRSHCIMEIGSLLLKGFLVPKWNWNEGHLYISNMYIWYLHYFFSSWKLLSKRVLYIVLWDDNGHKPGFRPITKNVFLSIDEKSGIEGILQVSSQQQQSVHLNMAFIWLAPKYQCNIRCIKLWSWEYISYWWEKLVL